MVKGETRFSVSTEYSSSLYDEELDGPYFDDFQSSHSLAKSLPNDEQKEGEDRVPLLSRPSTLYDQDNPIYYRFSQAFGERGVDAPSPVLLDEPDTISCIKFNRYNGMIAVGDKTGRIIIFKRARQATSRHCNFTRVTRKSRGREYDDEPENDDTNYDNITLSENSRLGFVPQYRFWTQFQSHEPEFDYLKSMDIEEKINQIQWCRHTADTCRLIATNDKTIKVWRVSEREVKSLAHLKLPNQNLMLPRSIGMANPTCLPRLEAYGKCIKATPRRVFSNAHAYHINSLSINSDEETFLSSDDLRVHLWNMNASGVGFNILDIKPSKMEDLSELITSTEFHPRHCHLFGLATSQGSTKIGDLREAALCHRFSRLFEVPRVMESRATFFTEIAASISDVKFSPDGRYLLTRDFMNLRLWDMHMEREPVRVIPVHEYLRSKLVDLYENACIFDKFQCCFSHDGGSLLTGSYNSLLQVYSASTGTGIAVEASIEFAGGMCSKYNSRLTSDGNLVGSGPTELLDPTKRIMYLDSSATEPVAAVAIGAALYVFNGYRL